MRHTSDGMQIDNIVIAILRRAGQIVMVEQYAPHNQRPYWVLPGGLVEAGEVITDALTREVREEAGVQVTAIGRLVGVSQIDRPGRGMQTLAFFFEIAEWEGRLQVQDPDGEVHRVELVPEDEALRRLAANGGWPGIQEPLLAYLRGTASAGALWCYREESRIQRRLIALPSLPDGEISLRS